VIVVAALLSLLLQVITQLLGIVIPLVVALMVAALLQPGSGALVRRGWPRSLAALALLLAGILVVAGIMLLVINRVAANWETLAGHLDKALTEVQGAIVRTFPITQHQLEEAVGSAQRAIGADQNAVASGALDTAGTVTQGLTGLLLTLLILFFFLRDGRSIWLWLIRLMPRGARADADEAARRSWHALVSYVRATVLIAFIDAVGIGVALLLLGVPLALPLAALVFLGAFIPVIGSFVAATIAVLVALVSKGFIVALLALAAAIVVMQLEGNLFSPLLLGRAVRVHPLAVVLSIAAGATIAGIFGALVAVPLVACLNVGGSYLAHRHEGPKPPLPRPDPARPVLAAR
jgi:predicted PurR-regulated permease PerM